MKIVVQRVKRASVKVEGEILSSIGGGLLLLAAIGPTDGQKEIDWICRKVCSLRIFEDKEGKMNLSLCDTGGDILAISQFTLYGSVKKGNRPSFSGSAPPLRAERLFNDLLESLESELGKEVGQGRFGAYMEVDLLNDGPVTIIIDTDIDMGLGK